MANILNKEGFQISKFKLKSRYYINFRADNFGKGMNFHIFPVMG